MKENWKNWPYWLKTLSVGIILGTLVDTYILFNQENLFLNQPACLAIGICDEYVSLPLVYTASASLLIGFSLVGASIGYLYGKFKNRKAGTIPLS